MDKLQDSMQDIDNYLRNMNPPDDVWDALSVILKAAQSYLDLPAKIEAMRKQIDTGDLDEEIEAEIVNMTIDDILNLIKEQQK